MKFNVIRWVLFTYLYYGHAELAANDAHAPHASLAWRVSHHDSRFSHRNTQVVQLNHERRVGFLGSPISAIGLQALGVGSKSVSTMSTTMRCISGLAAQYFVVYTLLAIVRTIGQLRQGKDAERSLLRDALETAELTLNFAPMLCVLFLAAQLQASEISKGAEDPSRFIQICMQVASIAVFAQTLLVILVPLITGSVPDIDDDVNLVSGSSMFLQISGYVIMSALYCSCAGVCAGILVMQAPQGIWPDVPPAVRCTINLALQFFVVHLLLVLSRIFDNARAFVRERQSSNNSQRREPRVSKMFQVLKLATQTVFFAPMLCILFLGARVRALQVGAEHGNPQGWAQVCFYLCTYSVLLQTILAVAVPLFIPGGDARRGTVFTEGDVELDIGEASGPTYVILALLRYIPSLLLYGGFSAVIISIFTITSPNGPTPPISPAVRCTMALTVQFFAVYLALWISILLRDIYHGQHIADSAKSVGSRLQVLALTLRSARATVHFCPMLAILFIGLRMRAQQLTQHQGAPQGWAQDAMYFCTASMLFQLFLVMALGIVSGDEPEVGPDGRPEGAEMLGPPWMSRIIISAQFASLLALYGGVVAICVALFVITPENAVGDGFLSFVAASRS